MTGSAIIEMFETLIDDSIDDTTAYILLNNAKNKVEEERDWSFLKKLDSSQSASSAAKTLPTDYRRTLAMYVGNQPYMQVPFEQQKLLQNSALAWYLDYANGAFYLLGSNLSGTINHFYIRATDDVASGTSPVWPSRFHPLIAFEMAELYFAIDQGERGRSWDDRWNLQKEVLRRAMVDWDTSLQLRASENAVPVDFDNEIPIGMM